MAITRTKLTAGIAAVLAVALQAGAATQSPLVPPGPERGITAAQVREDPRLEKPLAIENSSTTIEELLEQMSKQCGVTLSAGERDGAADVKVAAFYNHTALYKALNALLALVSYRPAPWKWERSGEAGHYSYRLLQPEPARQLREKLRNWVQARFESNAHLLMQAAEQGPDEKLSAIKQVYGKVDFERDNAMSADKMWAEIKCVCEGLTEEQITGVLRAESSARVQLTAVKPSTQDAMLGFWRRDSAGTQYWETRAGERVYLPLPTPNHLTVQRVNYGDGSTPAVLVMLAAVGSTAQWLFGGMPLEADYKAYLHKIWVQDSDDTSDPAERTVLAQPSQARSTPESPPGAVRTSGNAAQNGPPAQVGAKAASPNSPGVELTRTLEAISQRSGVALVARLPEDIIPNNPLPTPNGQSLGEYWKQLWNRPMMMKWHDGIQLVSTEQWPMEDEPVPLWMLRTLRKDRRPGRLLPFEDLVDCAVMLTGKQMLRLRPEFPVMEGLARLGTVMAMLQDKAVARAAFSERGIPITPNMLPSLRASLPDDMLAKIVSGQAQYLAVRLFTYNAGAVHSREVQLQLRDATGKTLGGLGFTEEARQPESRKPTAGN